MIDIKQPKVSIGIPTFNRPEGLQNTLECLTNQTYNHIEIIISDNCSPTDKVDTLAKRYASSDDRVKYFRQPKNMGAAFNFKFVLDMAEGDYFMWAADDDWWDVKFVENIVNLIQKTPGAIAGFSNYETINETDKQFRSPNPLPYLKDLMIENNYMRLSSFINQYEGHGKSNLFYSIIQTDILKNIPFDFTNEKVPLGGDLSLIYSWLRCGNIVIVEQVLRKVTIGNVKQNSQFITEYKDSKWKTIFLIISTGKFAFSWYTWKNNLFFYFYLTRTSQLTFITKCLLYLTITKKILLFCYDLVCYNVVIRGINVFEYLKRKETLAQ